VNVGMTFKTVLDPDFSVYLPASTNTPHATHQENGVVFTEWKSQIGEHNFVFPRARVANALELAKQLVRIRGVS
jgi:hypothetical protein